MMSDELKQIIINTAKDCAAGFLYYDRKEDEDLPRGAIEQAIKDGVITKQEIIDAFMGEFEDD